MVKKIKNIKSIKNLSMLLVFIITFGLITPPSVVNAATSAVQVTKTVDKTTIKVNEEAQVNLSIIGAPPVDVVKPNDVVLIIDRSGSMGQGSGKMEAAKNAAKGFVDLMDLTTHRVGIVDFSDTARAYPLSQDKDKAKAYIDTLNYGGSTETGAAVRKAIEMLSNHRPEAQPVIVILTDGAANSYPDARAAAQQAKDAGIVFYTIALLLSTDDPATSPPNQLLKEMATTEQHHHWVLGSTGLAEIYANIVKEIGIASAYDVVVKDVVSPEFEIVPGSYDNNIPRPEVVGNQLTWRLKELKDKVNLTYRITPKDKNKAGTFPVSQGSTIEYKNYLNAVENYPIEAPSIKVECLKPEITSVTPDNGLVNGGNEISIKGNNFSPNATVTIGSANATNVQVISANEIKATVPAGVQGTAVLTVTNNDGQTAQSNYKYYAIPEITSITPDKGYMEGGTSVTIAGNYYLPGVKVYFNGIEATVTNSTTTSITCTTPKSIVDGYVDVKVVNPDSREVTKTNGFKYVGKLEITSVTPDNGLVNGGNEISIKGNYFSPNATVTIGSANATNVQVISANEIKATVPAGVQGTAVLTVKNDDGQTAQSNYNYYAIPEITSITPNKGYMEGGTSVTIAGNYYLPGVKVFINNIEATVTDSTTTSITCITPKSSVDGDVDVKVVNPDSREVTKTNGFKYVGKPEITSVTPDKGLISGGNEISIKGNYFRPNATVTIGLANATNIQVISANEIKATVPAGVQGTAVLTVKNDDGQTAQSNYKYCVIPEITSITPSKGYVEGGASVTIAGNYYLPGVKVFINNIEATVTNSTTKSITCITPKSSVDGDVDVKVVNPDSTEVTKTNGFKYEKRPTPTITSIDPKEGQLAGGELVYIYGTNFDASAKVTIGGKDAKITLNDGIRIRVTAPSSTQPGAVDVVVTNPDEQKATLQGGYKYLAPPTVPAPTITSIDPKEGQLAGGELVYIYGTNFNTNANPTVTIGGQEAKVGFAESNRIRVTVPSSTKAGSVDVTVTNPDGQKATLQGGYKYLDPQPQVPAPTITSIDPKEGQLAGGELVYIYGTNFNTNANPTVTIGGQEAKVGFVESNRIRVTVPSSTKAGSVDVTVTNPDGQKATLQGGYKYLDPQPQVPAPTITSIDPKEGQLAGGELVYIYGTNFNTNVNPTVTIGGQVAKLGFVEPNRIRVTAPASTQPGEVDVTVTNPDGQKATLQGGYKYLPPPPPPAPTITSIDPNEGQLAGGELVYINGTNFNTSTKVTMGGQEAKINIFGANRLRVIVPSSTQPGAVDVTVTNDSQSATLQGGYKYLAPPPPPAPTVEKLSQTSGLITGGDIVLVTGTGFQMPTGSQTGTKAKLGGVDAVVLNYYSSTQIRIIIPKTTVTGFATLEITNPDGQSVTLTNAYEYLPVPLPPAPKITSLSQTSGSTTGGDYVFVNGTGFQSGIKAKLGGVDAQVLTYINSTQIRIVIPKSLTAGPVDLVLTNLDNQTGSLSAAYTYMIPTLTVTKLSATSGEYQGGYYINVYGTNFDPKAKVTVNGKEVAITYYADTQLKINSMPSASDLGLGTSGGTVNIKVTNPSGSTADIAFTYNAKPLAPVANITKISGPGGTAATGPLAGGNYLYFYGTGFSSTMKVRIYDSSNNKVYESQILNYYGDTSSRHLMPAVSTAGTYTLKLVNQDGVESNGMQYEYK